MGRSKERGVALLYLYPSLEFSLSVVHSLSSHDIQKSDGYFFVLQVGYTVTKELYIYIRESERERERRCC
jgi:hypothetical protein